MALNKDSQDRLNSIKQEEQLQRSLQKILSERLTNSKELTDSQKKLSDSLLQTNDLEDKLLAIQEQKNIIFKTYVGANKELGKKLIEQLQTMEELLEHEKKRKDKTEEIKNLIDDTRDSLLQSVGLSSDMFKNGIKFGIGMMVAKKGAEMLSSAFDATVGLAKDLYTQTGATAAEAGRLSAQTMGAMLSMEGLLYGGEALAKAAQDASEYYGSTAVITADMQKNITKLSAMGVEGAAQMNSIFESASGNAGELTGEIQAIAQDAGVNASAVLKDMSSNMTAMVGKSKEELKYLAKKTAELHKQGMSVALIEDMSSNMLDIESSLKAQMKARAFGMGDMLGDTEKMRNAAMEIQFGDKAAGMEQMADAMKEAGLSSEKLGNMGTKQIEILAQGYGMSGQQLTEMITKEEELAKIKKESGVATTAEAIAIQEKQAANKAAFASFTAGAAAAAPAIANLIGQLLIMKTLKSSVESGGGTGDGGGGGFFSSLTGAIEKIDGKKLMEGGAALVLVAAAVFVFAKAVQEFMNVSWEAVGMAVVSMLALVGAVALLGTFMTGPVGLGVLVGAAAMLVIAAALFVLGKAIQEIATGFGMMGELTTQLTALVMIAPGLIALAGIFGMLGIGLMGMGVGLALVTVFLPTLLLLAATLPLISSALGMGGGESGGGAGGGGGNTADPLLEEIKGLRADIQSQPIVIKVNDKLVTEMSRANSRMETVRRQHR
jgi:hypothetical protein